MKNRFLIVIPLLGALPATAAPPAPSHSAALAAQGLAATTVSRGSEPSAFRRVASEEGSTFNVHEKPRPLPEVSFTDVEGRPVTLAAFRGKVTLLNIWATWCAPCRAEMPTLERLEVRLGGPDFQVVALSIDQGGVSVVRDFYEQLGLQNLEIYMDDEMQVPPTLGVVGIPGTLLIDREGREIGRKLGPAEWDSEEIVAEIQRYLKQ